MSTLSYAVPIPGVTSNAIADPQVATALTTILTWANGGVDANNLSALLAQSACVNQSGQTVKGAVNIATSQSTSSTSYTTLSTPDQVTGIVLPTNGLIAVWYQATWQESVAGVARAAIFLGGNQLQVAISSYSTPGTTAAATDGGNPGTNTNLSTFTGGLVSAPGAGGGSQLTTGQALGLMSNPIGSNSRPSIELNGAVLPCIANDATREAYSLGGPCHIFAAAGTYTVSVQFKASSGTVTASNRRLWVQAISFS